MKYNIWRQCGSKRRYRDEHTANHFRKLFEKERGKKLDYYELNFMRGVLRFKVTDFISFVDVFTNSIVADVLVNRKINNAKDKCKDAIRSVNSIRSDLVDLLKKYQENHED